jgi:hypothetical protein
MSAGRPDLLPAPPVVPPLALLIEPAAELLAPRHLLRVAVRHLAIVLGLALGFFVLCMVIGLLGFMVTMDEEQLSLLFTWPGAR